MLALNRFRVLLQALCGAGVIALRATGTSAGAADRRLPGARPSLYSHDGVIYDRLLSALRRPAMLARRVPTSSGTPAALRPSLAP